MDLGPHALGNPDKSTRPGVTAGLAVLMVALAYGWIVAAANPVIPTRSPEGYYALLTEAFLSGQTYLKGQPDPQLALLADPYRGAQGVPRLHDASYFHGHYYLYFGPAPVIFLYAPWRWLTGTYLTDGAGTTIFALAGFVAGGCLLGAMWRRWFAGLRPGWLVGALLVWGGGNYALVLAQSAAVYAVPIMCGYALLMSALLALWAALRAGSPGRTLGWLGVGSFLWACTVAARPNYLIGLPALGLPALSLLGARGASAARRVLRGLVVAAPVVAVGAALAAYNWVRFHSIFDFGVSYMMAGADQRHLRLLDAGRVPGNLAFFLFGVPQYVPYFPFQAPGAGAFGVLACAPAALLALAFPLTLRLRAWRPERPWGTMGGTLLAVFGLNFLALSVSFTNERYFLDFLPAGILLGLLTGLGLVRASHRGAFPRRSARAARLLVAALGGLTLVQGGIFALSRYPDQPRLAALARPVDRLVARLEPWLGIAYGPLEFRAAFQPRPGRIDPLVVSGDGRDVLFVSYPAEDRIQFGFHHAGAGGPTGAPLTITPGHAYDLVINLGALYPPRDHPAFDAWTDVQSEVLHRVVSVRLDGRDVLEGASYFYPTTPWNLEIGRNRGGLITGPRFNGRLEPVGGRRIPPPTALPTHRLDGAERLTLLIPPFDVYKTEPLISTGHMLAGDLIFLTYLGPGRIRFGHDSWNGGAIVSPPVDYTPGQPGTLEVDMGSLHPLRGTEPAYGPLLFRFNGRLILVARRPFYPTTGPEVAYGFNGIHSSVASQIFSGRILSREPIAAAVPAGAGPAAGPLHLVVRFPGTAMGTSEPLVVTGRTGAGDLVYVTYVDATHLRVGYDHWLVGGPHGALLPVDYSSPHDLEICLGSLLPPVADAWWGATPAAERVRLRRLVRVTLDGALALETTSDPYPAAPGQVYVGANPIGGSTCQPTFSGGLFVAERSGPDALSAAAPAAGP